MISAPYLNFTNDKKVMDKGKYIHYIEDINVDNYRQWRPNYKELFGNNENINLIANFLGPVNMLYT